MNEKKLYAVADKVPARKAGYLTAGKKYEVVDESRTDGFKAYADNGGLFFAAWKGSFHLDGGDWRRVVE